MKPKKMKMEVTIEYLAPGPSLREKFGDVTLSETKTEIWDDGFDNVLWVVSSDRGTVHVPAKYVRKTDEGVRFDIPDGVSPPRVRVLAAA